MASHCRRNQFFIVNGRHAKKKQAFVAWIIGTICFGLLIILSLHWLRKTTPMHNTNETSVSSELVNEDDASLGTLISTEMTSRGAISTYSSDKGLQDTAHALLQNYREAENCLLIRSGYLDLFGNTWSCTVSFGNAVEVCFVSEDQGGKKCEVKVLRMEESQWEEVYGGDQALPGTG